MVYAVAILLISALTTVGLIAVWAATSPGNWFWRTMAFLGAMSPLLLIPAYEPFVAFVIQGAVVAAGVQLARWRANRGSGEPIFQSRFSLKTILLIMVPLAVMVAVGVKIVETEDFIWLGSVQIGIVAGILSLTAFWIAKGKAAIGWRVIVGIATVAALTWLLQWKEWFVSETVEFGFEYDLNNPEWWNIPYRKSIAVGLTWLAVVALTMVCTAIICDLAVPSLPQRSLRKRIAMALSLILAVPSVVAWMFLIQKPPIPNQVLPQPNGYDDYLAAAQTLPHRVAVYSNNFDPDTDSLDVVRNAIEEVQPAIDLVRVGLSKDIQKPLDYSSVPSLGLHDACRKIGAGLEAKGKLAERQNDHSKAAEEYIMGMQFATRYFCESTILDFLLGKASFERGFSGLFLMRDDLARDVQVKLISELAEIEQQVEPLEQLVERDNALQIHVYGWREHLRQVMAKLPGVESFMEKAFPSLYRRHIADLRLLQVELALRVWRSEHGEWPKSIESLVPSYLPTFPVDPFSNDGQSLRYSQTEDYYLLYSVGYNGIDDHGKADPDDPTFGDRRLDVLWAPQPAAAPDTSVTSLGDEQDDAEPINQ